ncbi:hypothetical protein F66182_7032 [Fusarium sp. NRRL 66182]|nr:hypothetical protein F66182_7032 [Fusarium sp. NRRL 66182]
MATTFGPERLTRPSPGPAFDSPADRFTASMSSFAGPQSLDSSAHVDEPPPNPPFVFPAQPPASVSAPSSFSRATGRRPMSAIETPNFSFGFTAENAERQQPRSTLPDFSFNPGALLHPDSQDNFLLTPPVSPHSPRNIASSQRPGGHGHRRGGSEFVGGRIREGNSIAIMSTSPTKSESGLVTPTFQPPRRGHRRGMSGAISTNDLPILQPPIFDAAGRGNSAPTSPTSFGQPDDKAAPLELESQIMPEPAIAPEVKVLEEPQEPVASNPPKDSPKQPKARVGFSDTLEFIPRPLSLISNETSSTVTARPGHSVSGSISSIISGTSPSGRESPSPLSQTPTREISDSRPSTAGAILEGTHDMANMASPKRRNSIPTLLNFAEGAKVETPEPSPTKKRWSFFAREPSAGNTSPTRARPQSSGGTNSPSKAAGVTDCGFNMAGEGVDVAPIKTKSSKKSKKKKKKVKGWAGAILPRKAKGHSKRPKSEGGRPPTPPASSISRDNGKVEMYGEPELLEVTTPTLTITESPNLPREDKAPKRSMEESAYPMIDLDAALGPFNTPLPLNPEWEAAQRAAGGAGKRRLHSAQGMKGFSGPGMHYHRRAESAPDLPPFDYGRAGMHRYNSSSTMADVFEEDEEDEDDNTRSGTDSSEEETDSDSDVTPPAAATRDPLRDSQDKLSTHSSTQSMRRALSGLTDKDQISPTAVRAERSRSSLHESVIAEELPSVIFRSPFMPAERIENASSSPSSMRRSSGNDLAHVDVSPLHLPAPANVPNSPYAMSYSSSFPSPRSPMSVDVQRISTAPSSVADENNFQSLLLMGEPGPEVRISVDYDIPSLTSSNSTMTRESMFLPSQRQSQPILREPRPVSVSSAFGRRRSSLASLSRLISSSHGERSKLSTEVTLDNDDNKKKLKSSRTKKLGRMMQFWKPTKEKEGEAK